MQADEDVDKIALGVPVLVCKPSNSFAAKSLELFLQDLCDGTKTMNSVHLKHCVQSYNVFDFLRDIVGRVPDYGHGHADPASDDRTLSRRKKAVGDDGNDTHEETKRSRMLEMGHDSTSGKRRGCGRGRNPRGRSLVI
ncbi:hypothetical protein SAY87_007647 [Trapa incisa]|uniref:Dr1-associated corepressor n=1 Tax=Trapa incisa TaxID=236973 RepID=A0AAN7KFE8_9MYRT|nr:hypothetical protein SAY87_007647 [Trapa incisa]